MLTFAYNLNSLDPLLQSCIMLRLVPLSICNKTTSLKML